MQANKSLSTEYIANLWEKYRKNNDIDARNKLIKNYLSMVKNVAGHISYSLPAHIERDDLISSGFFGLMDAISRFDNKLGIKFETYARNRIRGSILDYLRSRDWLSVPLRKKIKTYETVYTKLGTKLQRTPTKKELAAAMNLTVPKLHVLESNMNLASMTPLEDYITAEYADRDGSIDKNLNREFVKKQLTQAIEKLPEKEKLIISLYYNEEMTLKEIGMTLNLSEARISQLHKRAVLRLRSYLAKTKEDFLDMM